MFSYLRPVGGRLFAGLLLLAPLIPASIVHAQFESEGGVDVAQPASLQGSKLPTKSTRHPQLIVPPTLRARVNFWIDIFARYGKYQSVIHHREFPQAVFAVVDVEQDVVGLNPVAASRLKDAAVADKMAEVKTAIRYLGDGNPPRNALEQRIIDAMRLVPGRDKWSRLVDGISGATDEKKQMVRSQTGIRHRCMEAVQRSGSYLREMERIFVSEYNLPRELTRLPFIESSFDYRATSSVGAAGIWQLMPMTAKKYMTVSRLVDERRDPVLATHAAARYLQHAHEELGSWPLAIMSYNHGIAGVSRKVRAFGSSDIVRLVETPGEKPFGFASSNFYPEFLAALEIFDDPHRFFPDLEINPPRSIQRMKLKSPIGVHALSRKLGVNVEDLREVNYSLADSVWKGKHLIPAGYSLSIPQSASSRAELLQVSEIRPSEPMVENAAAYHVVRRGESLTTIAKRYRMSVDDLKALNGLGGNEVRLGQQLAVKRFKTPPTTQRSGVKKVSAKKQATSAKASKKTTKKSSQKTKRTSSN